MVLIGNEYLDQLFVWHVDYLRESGNKEPMHTFTRLNMAHTLRILVTEGRGNELAFRVQKRYSCPLWVLDPEPISGNTPADQLPTIPTNVTAYATPITVETHPFGMEGYYHKPYPLRKYLGRPLGILMGRAVNSREVIKFLANKLGGSHADDELVGDAETLHFLNEGVLIFGEKAIFSFFDDCAEMIWRALAPLRDEVVTSLRASAKL
jgi:hypothetical protein